MRVGIELSGLPATDRARGVYLLNELKALDFDTSIIGELDIVDIRIMLKRDARAWYREKKEHEIRIFDVSDAILNPPANRSFLHRLYQHIVVNPRYGRFLAACDAIVVASRPQQLAINKYNKNVYVIPDSSYYHIHYDPFSKPDPSERVVFVWDGQGHNLQYLDKIISNNINFFQKNDVLLKVVTDNKDELNKCNNKEKIKSYKINAEFIEWTEATFMKEVNAAHVGLAPVDLRCPHASAKPDNKLVNYQGLGLPAIASATIAYNDFSQESPGGVFTCIKDIDWADALEYWRVNRKEALSKGLKGREFVLATYRPAVLARNWQHVIHDLTNKN